MAIIVRKLDFYCQFDAIPQEVYLNAKVDQLRITFINSKFFNMKVHYNDFTKIIHRRNSQIYKTLSNAPEGHYVVLKEVAKALKPLYGELNLEIEPRAFLTEITFYGGRRRDKKTYGERPSASYTIHTDIGEFIVQFVSVYPFNGLLIFNPVRMAKRITTIQEKDGELEDDNVLDRVAYDVYEKILKIFTTERNISRYLIEPFFRFLITYPELQTFKFRYWLCYAEINQDIGGPRLNRSKIIKSCERIIRDCCRRVITKHYDDLDWTMILGDYRREGLIQFKVYPKREDFIRVELTYTSSYMKDANWKRRLPYDEYERINVIGKLLEKAGRILRVVVSHIQGELIKEESTLPPSLRSNYIAEQRRLLYSETKIKVYEYLINAPRAKLSRKDICKATGLKPSQVGNVLRQIPYLLERENGSYKFEVKMEGRIILKKLLEYVKTQGAHLYKLTKEVAAQFSHVPLLYQFCRIEFIKKPSGENYRQLVLASQN